MTARSGERRWSSRHWICCDIHYKNKQHDAMGRYYTSVFFLDEVTALAAGHRPCFFCRRKDAQHFLSLAAPPLMADAADRILHEQRFASRKKAVTQECAIADLPDGAMVAIDGVASCGARRSPAALVVRGLRRCTAAPHGEARDAHHAAAVRDHSREWFQAALARQRALGGDRAAIRCQATNSVMDSLNRA